MLTAKKNSFFQRVFAIYNRNLLRRKFNSLRVCNDLSLVKPQLDFPLIVISNHSSWWDGLVFMELLRIKEFDSYVMMEAQQLKKRPLFRRLGAFSVNKVDKKDLLLTLNYAVRLLSAGENKTLLIFPQGKILPNDQRPMKFFNGVSYILQQLEKGTIIPCSLRYEYLNDFKADIFVRFGAPEFFKSEEIADRKIFTASLENKMTLLLDQLKKDISMGNFSEYENIL